MTGKPEVVKLLYKTIRICIKRHSKRLKCLSSELIFRSIWRIPKLLINKISIRSSCQISVGWYCHSSVFSKQNAHVLTCTHPGIIGSLELTVGCAASNLIDEFYRPITRSLPWISTPHPGKYGRIINLCNWRWRINGDTPVFPDKVLDLIRDSSGTIDILKNIGKYLCVRNL